MQEQKQTRPCTGNKIVDEKGKIYESIRTLADAIGVSRFRIAKFLGNEGRFFHNEHTYTLVNPAGGKSVAAARAESEKAKESGNDDDNANVTDMAEIDPEYAEYLEKKKIEALPFEQYKIEPNHHNGGERYAIALFSDAHIEETVTPESTMGLNEYNIEIAENRIKHYFANLASCINEDKVSTLYFASLGDTISGYIHEELQQTNQMSPLEATLKGQSLIYSGLEYILGNCPKLKDIVFIGVCGNHSRTTKKVQHNNFTAMSVEFLMYKNIEQRCKDSNLPIKFVIPESEMAIVMTPDNKRFMFAHGTFVKSNSGTVCGPFMSLNRMALKYEKSFKPDKIYIGHLHQCIDMGNSTMVNGSIISYTAYSLANGFQYERPAQMYEVRKLYGDVLLTRKIYCD